LNHIDKRILCVLQNYLPILSHLKVNTLRAGQTRNHGSITGKGKNSALPQFARPLLGPTKYPLHWLMEISGRGMRLTAHLNLARRSRVHGAISPLTHRPSYIVQERYLFLHFIWRTLPLLDLQVTSWAILRLPISAMLRRRNFPVGNYLDTELQQSVRSESDQVPYQWP
jgi:hypothetical protein